MEQATNKARKQTANKVQEQPKEQPKKYQDKLNPDGDFDFIMNKIVKSTSKKKKKD